MQELSHLDRLEAEAIYILREVAAECERPVMLYSIGKDSSVMLHLAQKAFYPEKPPFPFLHIDMTWKFHEMITFRDETARKYGLEMLVYTNEEGVRKGINPFEHGPAYTDIMKTQALRQGLEKYGFTAAFGGGRRDEEKSRAKERIFSFRNSEQAWDPRNQRPEMWKLYNTRLHRGESMRVFPISNWTETDIWQYIRQEGIGIVPLYFAKERPVVERDGNLIMVDDDSGFAGRARAGGAPARPVKGGFLKMTGQFFSWRKGASMGERMIYLDYAADTPADPAVLDVFCRTAQSFPGNPNSVHPAGRAARAELARVTDSIAGMLDPSMEVIHTSGASESNSLAIRGTAQRHAYGHMIASVLEHPSVTGTLAALERQGWEIG